MMHLLSLWDLVKVYQKQVDKILAGYTLTLNAPAWPGRVPPGMMERFFVLRE
jgi:hypothetical protein